MSEPEKHIISDMQQGSAEWHSLRKTKITATDSYVIMGASRYKTPLQLFEEKMSIKVNNITNERMQRGIDLEPMARAIFCLTHSVFVEPKIVVKDWAMASLDGMSEDGKIIVEIKCPGERDHNTALMGEIPDHYYAQLQHQMYVCDVENMYYYSFNGTDGVTIEVLRNDEFISTMIEKEKNFYDCMLNNTPEKL